MQHQKQWEFLRRKFETGTLSHAYLFLGQQGLGKIDFALEFVRFLGCKSPEILLIKKKEDKSEIEISQIREAQNFLSYKSYYGSHKVVIVDGAEQMNQEAQSCFLKTLEEPKGSTLLILISSKPDLILQTISSRCQVVKFFGKPKEDEEKIKQEKEVLSQILKVASSDLSEKFKFVKSLDLESAGLAEILKVLQKHFRGLLLAETNKENLPKIIKNIKLIEEISNKITLTNASPKLALEILLMEL
jgi:DNA polymerase-3 subunit delta'